MLKSITRLGFALALATASLTPVHAADKLRVAMIASESGIGDRSFNDMVLEGMKRAKKELDVDYVVVQPRAISDFQSALARASGQGFDLIVGNSFDMVKPMDEVAKQFPDQKYGLIDAGMEVPNIVAAVAKDWEGSFLVGWIAAKTTKTHKIGFVGGKDIPVIHRFFTGYYYGAKLADPKVEVIERYSGTFTDPAVGKEYTLALVNEGSDINYAVAGATSSGIIDGARESNTLAIGVDSNQNYLAPGHVLTSMMKRVDTITFDMIKSVKDGKYQGGKTLMYGLKEGGVDIAMDDNNKGLIPPDVLKGAEEMRAKVASGEIVVPNFFDLKPGAKTMGKPEIETPPSIANAK
ncbi:MULTISPECIES: BMP family lipoprotein [Mesorhizobium]|uniref:Nucleoside-binding protein n=1 Tax=Mesorhizobium qingshengii TaxID=1165689 RepID=A0A1G5ZWQ7_9HYPH|nr:MULTISPECIES: BMP family ABC transporter substrate-binding protein [Mesorhizobium]AID34980.1 BMP family ABC transporter substrate-binding protein [Mesorhizobium huakuii 7653R]MCH4560641.1 BMP family ABC transporter substrate-binding protein [Mesorhizobium jarvisii]SDA99092.1 nucleoside-binding protein [Mesorhizobium qingshengii]